jgi:peptidoglycan hydrolase-like protein with peptidoglycan-binding domain
VHAGHRRRHHGRPARGASPAGRRSARGLGNQTLLAGSSGKDVRLVQELLGVSATGTYDAATTAAVKKFQLAHGVKGTGVVAQATHEALRRAFP